MTKKQLDNWLNKLGKAWEERDPQKAASLFTRDVVYYESPFEKPCSSWKEVLNLWLEVPKNQKNIKFGYEVIMVLRNLGLAHWTASYSKIADNTEKHLDGVFLVSLNTKGLCTFFKQWEMTKPGFS